MLQLFVVFELELSPRPVDFSGYPQAHTRKRTTDPNILTLKPFHLLSLSHGPIGPHNPILLHNSWDLREIYILTKAFGINS